MALSWVSVNATTGSVVADLPGLRVDGSLKRTIGRHESQTAVLPLDGAPENWRDATREKAVFLVALTDATENDPRGRPIWGGLITEVDENDGDSISISIVTAEDYLNDRYVGDENYSHEQNIIVANLVDKYVAPGGIPIRVVMLPGANPVRQRTYLDRDDKTVGALIDELSGVSGGPEWTIDWEWIDERKLGLVLYVGERIGSPAPADLGPSSWFYLPGNVTRASLVRGFRRSEGANDVMAVSSGSGDARPQSSRHVAPADGRPKIEFRWSPSTSITDQDTLESHAERALNAMKGGTRQLSVTATTDETTPFNLGDEIGFDLLSRAWPNGITGTARVMGIEWTDTTVTPVLDVTHIEGIN